MTTQSHRQGGGHRRLPSTPPPSVAFRFEVRPDQDDFGPDPGTEAACASAAGLVRWGAFSCALTPLTLLACGVPLITALVAGAGLAAVTAACGALLRRSEHAYAQHSPYSQHARGRHSRTGTGLHRGGRNWGHWGHPSEP